eukprot:scaffold18575_cov104-Isochrysis_galbana.AAC.7
MAILPENSPARPPRPSASSRISSSYVTASDGISATARSEAATSSDISAQPLTGSSASIAHPSRPHESVDCEKSYGPRWSAGRRSGDQMRSLRPWNTSHTASSAFCIKSPNKPARGGGWRRLSRRISGRNEVEPTGLSVPK